jgi:hypothetical protein
MVHEYRVRAEASKSFQAPYVSVGMFLSGNQFYDMVQYHMG